MPCGRSMFQLWYTRTCMPRFFEMMRRDHLRSGPHSPRLPRSSARAWDAHVARDSAPFTKAGCFGTLAIVTAGTAQMRRWSRTDMQGRPSRLFTPFLRRIACRDAGSGRSLRRCSRDRRRRTGQNNRGPDSAGTSPKRTGSMAKSCSRRMPADTAADRSGLCPGHRSRPQSVGEAIRISRGPKVSRDCGNSQGKSTEPRGLLAILDTGFDDSSDVRHLRLDRAMSTSWVRASS